MKNPIITVFRFVVNLITVWMVVEAGLTLGNIYVTMSGAFLLVGWLLGFIERYES